MKGFDPKFTDLTDYILGITHEIWEERQLDTLRGYYSDDVIVRSPDGVVTGNETVIDATNATLSEFPDRQLLGEDVIWSGNAEDGFLSSHRILSTATHLGDGAFGPPSGRRFVYRVIADCAAKDNQIYDEWLVRDLGAIVRQLDTDPKQYAADRITAEGGPEAAAVPFTPDTDVQGRYLGTGNNVAVGAEYADIITSIMNEGGGAIEARFDRAAHLELPGGVGGHGWADATDFWVGLRSSFPDAEFTVHHTIGMDERGMSPRAALRWSLDGTHGGTGTYGAPTGARVHVMGISHAEFGPRGLRREWVLLDEVAIWKQILLAR